MGIVAVRIEIPRLGIDLPIVEGDGIDAPLHKAAHYPGTGWPDGGSNIYLYGHAQAGMFLALWEAATGDEVILTLVDGSQRTYRIDRVMPKVPMGRHGAAGPDPGRAADHSDVDEQHGHGTPVRGHRKAASVTLRADLPTDPAPPIRPRKTGRRFGIAARVVGTLFAVAVGLALVLGFLAVTRYLPALDDSRALRASFQSIADRAASAGLGVTRIEVDALRGELRAAAGRQASLASLLRDDPVVGLARLLPEVGQQVRGADELIAATGNLVVASEAALRLADRFVEIRETHEAGTSQSSTLAALVELMATSTSDADQILAEVTAARTRLVAIPLGLAGPIEQARALALEKIDRYLPTLEGYTRADDLLAEAMGWSGRRRYLVLAQDPAELRPSGGFVGTIGIVVFEHGDLASKQFQDVYNLDRKPGLPYVEPPTALKNHLLGMFSWRLADANWFPDFPMSAKAALDHYALETGDRDLDGVIALNTYAIDELLTVTGPVDVPEFDVTVTSGETTLTSLQQTRIAAVPGTDRKAFLDVFADRMIGRLFSLPSKDWASLLPRLETIGQARQVVVWLADPTEQQLVADAGWDGAVRQDAGDFLYPVDSNVAPIGKLNLVTDRAFDLDIALDEVGNARNRLEVTWTNTIASGQQRAPAHPSPP